MLQKTIIEAQGKCSYEEVEEMANQAVKDLSAVQKMTYGIAYDILKAHEMVIKEAVSHLNHNAAIEKRSETIRYVLS